MDDTEDTPATEETPADGGEPELEIAVEDDQGDQMAALQAKLDEEHDRLLRTAAELDNVRKRARRAVDDASARGRAEVLAELLPAIDAIDLALKNADEAAPARAVIDGIEMVRRQFLASMGRFGLKPLACVGAPFDPNFHEAVAQIPHAALPAGAIIEDLRRGYVLGERLLRASLVVVSAGAPPAAAEAPAAAETPDTAAPTEEETHG